MSEKESKDKAESEDMTEPEEYNEDTSPTLSASEQLERIRKRREARLQQHEPTVATDSYVPSKSGEPQDGHKEEYTIEDVSEDKEDYPLKEADDQIKRKKGTNNSGTEPSPFND